MTISSMSSTKSMKHLFLRLFYKMQMKGTEWKGSDRGLTKSND